MALYLPPPEPLELGLQLERRVVPEREVDLLEHDPHLIKVTDDATPRADERTFESIAVCKLAL